MRGLRFQTAPLLYVWIGAFRRECPRQPVFGMCEAILAEVDLVSLNWLLYICISYIMSRLADRAVVMSREDVRCTLSIVYREVPVCPCPAVSFAL